MNEQQLEGLFNALKEADCSSEMSDVLSPLSEADLDSVHDEFLDQYGLELALGALERSAWRCGNLIINANQPSICFFGTALEAIREKKRERKAGANGSHGI